jgi:hypothetical protein
MIIPTNPGEFWTAISSVLSLGVIIIALIPIIENWNHKIRINEILRQQILFEAKNIHESYFGKILVKIKKIGIESIPYQMPNSDHKYFRRLNKLFEKSTFLKINEKNILFKMLEIYNKSVYRKLDNGKNFMMSEDVYMMESYSYDLIKKIEGELDVSNDNYIDQRKEAYNRITNIGRLSGIEYVEYDEIMEFLDK